MMLIGEGKLALLLLDEFLCRCAADRALSRGIVAFVDVTADTADKFFHSITLLNMIHII